MEKLPISLVLSCGDVVIRIKLPHGDKKLGAVAKAFAKSYEAKHKVALPLEAIRFRRRSRFITASLQARVGDVFEDGDNVTVSVGDDKPSPAPRAAPALDTLGPPATDDEKQLGATLLNNRAACHLKQDRFADAQGDCDAPGAEAVEPAPRRPA
ncbi:hypothetical protein JL720_16398 [Aureococcus anophagefferens]|nr:hypothetical protein JL720_16398 [Aureococcus anophagefferens]